MHKIWFYISLLSLLIGGVYFSLPSDAEREQMRVAAQKRKAEQKKKQQQNQSNPQIQSASMPQ